jgi:Ca2+-binding RTX toxin-like protein
MAFNGTSGNDIMDYSAHPYGPPADWPEVQIWLTINGLGGNDTIYGSPFKDDIYGGDGSDTLYGNAGNDSLDGGAGIDYLFGGEGNDWLRGGEGNDNLDGGNGDDWFFGDNGNDTIYGRAGDDTFVGGGGNDVIWGGAGNDVIFGEAGADTMRGEAGNDRLWGGAGNDTYYFSGQGQDIINDGLTSSGSVRSDTAYDTADRLVVSYTSNEIEFYTSLENQNLLITSAIDAADGLIENYIVIENFFAGGHYAIESLQTANGVYNFSDIFPTAFAA